jgi:peptidyl-prolyl cis-trans isomerase A (cyclophilin A)
MNIRRTLLFSSLAVAGIAGAAFALFGQQSAPPAAAAASQQVPDAPQATPEATTVPNGPFVVMDTSMGRITCQFYQKQAPKAVANFIGLAEGTKDWTDPTTKKVEHHKPYYDGTIFHRVIPQFMIQGGDPTGTGMGDPGYTFDDEFDPGLNFDRPGRLAMANSGPNTNGSQFFITEQATDFLDQHYTLFGQCDDASVSVVKAIARVERDSNDRPREQVVLKKVWIVREGGHMPPAAGEADTPHSQPRRFIAVSSEVEAGMKVYSPAPVRQGDVDVSGTVVFNAIIDENGSVESLHVISGPPILQQAALDAVKSWRYKPFLVNGEPVAVKTQINVIFTLAR